MSHRTRACAVLALAACTRADDAPTGPGGPPPAGEPTVAAVATPTRQPERDRHERFARRFAKALREPSFRAAIHQAIASSTDREGKVHLQDYLDRDGGRERRTMAQLAGESDAAVLDDLDQGDAIEFYFPVPEHRRRWSGDATLLVATAERDADQPVAFDLQGGRRLLSASAPPATPVLMVARAERRWGSGPSALTCAVGCGGGGGGGGGTGGGTTPATSQGLYLTQASFRDNFEGWFKGDPEFEIHIMGPTTPGSQKMTSYQCIGQTMGGAYYWDQNNLTWSGNVLLFSPAQLDQFRTANGTQGFRILAIEDDDTSCEIKVDSTRVVNMLNAIQLVYGSFTAATDSTLSFTQRILKPATALHKLLSAARSFFVTNDDPIGNAVADSVAASSYFAGANWLVRGENSQSNGALKLIMK